MSRVVIKDLKKAWGDVIGVNDVSFEVPEGSLTVLLGPSGCGKSTILRLIAGLETATAGSVVIGNRDVTTLDPADRGVSMVFQSYALFPHLTVRENILFGLKVRKISKRERERRLKEAAAMVGLSELLDRRPSQLSGGQRQRVALARSIVSRRKICLMDEPLSNLDAKLRAEMRDEICALQKRLAMTMIYVTHDQVEAMTMADQVVLLNRGSIVQAGSPRRLYDVPEDTFAARFMGSPPMNLIPFARSSAQAALAQAWQPAADDPGTGFIGIRPEHLSLSRQGLECEVKGLDYLGSETLLKVVCRDQVLFVKTVRSTPVRVGDPVCLSWQEDHVHLFDPDGRSIPARISSHPKRPAIEAAC